MLCGDLNGKENQKIGDICIFITDSLCCAAETNTIFSSNYTPIKINFKKLKIELPYDLAISLLGIYPEKTIIQKYTCTPMFIAALFTIARTWKQPRCPSTDEWIKKMWHIYTMEY